MELGGRTMIAKRLLYALLVMALALVLFPVEAQAVTLGDFEVTGTAGGYSYASNMLTFSAPGEYAVAMASGVTSTSIDRIVVNAGKAENPVRITLTGVDINRYGPGGSCAFDIQGNSVVELTLEAGTSNSLRSGPNYAGLNMADGAALTITANGTGANTGALSAQGGSRCAGIGGGELGNGGTVYIFGGAVSAQGGIDAAGIGGGHRGNGGAVYISGGAVSAFGMDCGSGIGGGRLGSGGIVTISGGTVYAQGGSSGAGIGDGSGGSGGAVYISGGSVCASGFTDIHGTLMDRPAAQGGVNVYRTTLTLTPDLSIPQTAMGFDGVAADYGSCGLAADEDGVLYFYLPAGDAGAAYGGSVYTATVDTYHNNAFALTGAGYVLRHKLINLTVDNKDTMIRADSPYIAKLTPGTGWSLPGSIEITMGGAPLGTGYTYDSATGNLTIDAGVTDDILITAVGGAGREIELRAGATHIQWRYEGESEWRDLVALSAVTGPQGPQGTDGTDGTDGGDGRDGGDGADGQDGRDGKAGADGNGIIGIRIISSDGNADTYAITFTNDTEMTFTVMHGRDGAGIASGMIDERGGLAFTLTDGTKLNIGRINELIGSVPAGGTDLLNKKDTDITAIAALAVSVIALLFHLGWLVPLLRRKITRMD